MKKIYFIVSLLVVSILLIAGCEKENQKDDMPDPTTDVVDLSDITFAPTAKKVNVPENFPPFPVTPDNPITEEGVHLGRLLFFDPILSRDSSMSCASCHFPRSSFTDERAFSVGVDGKSTPRSSMSLLDLAYVRNGLFWDGRVKTLEEQALLPVEDPIELHDDWENVEEKLQRHPDYPKLFRTAFGISTNKDISKYLAVKAIAQFERTLVSSGNSKYDQVVRNEAFFTEAELNGFDMFFDVSPDVPDAECGHCHNAPFFTTDDFFNNGLNEVNNLADFPDKGLGAVTGNIFDNGKFRAPTLRNIMLTAPYMHDGRFQTIEEVIEHYNSGGHYAENRDPLIVPLRLTETQKGDLIAFLKTLTDEDFLKNPDFQNPFE